MKIFILFVPVLLSGIILCIVLDGCNKSKDNTFSINNFPNKVGDQWVYELRDSLKHVSEILTVTIVGNGSFNGQPSHLWQYSYSNGTVDTFQVVQSGDTINFYTYSEFPVLITELLFPTQPGLRWIDNNYALSDTTAFISNFSSLNRQYTDVYTNTITSRGPDYSLYDCVYLNSNVGIVSRYTREFSLGWVTNQELALISYHLN